jgi:hypothetical protein
LIEIVEPVAGSVSLPFHEKSSSFADRFDCRLLKKIRKKPYFGTSKP